MAKRKAPFQPRRFFKQYVRRPSPVLDPDADIVYKADFVCISPLDMTEFDSFMDARTDSHVHERAMMRHIEWNGSRKTTLLLALRHDAARRERSLRTLTEDPKDVLLFALKWCKQRARETTEPLRRFMGGLIRENTGLLEQLRFDAAHVRQTTPGPVRDTVMVDASVLMHEYKVGCLATMKLHKEICDRLREWRVKPPRHMEKPPSICPYTSAQVRAFFDYYWTVVVGAPNARYWHHP